MDFPTPYRKIYQDGGVDWDLKISPRPLHMLVYESAQKYPDKTALIFYGHKMTYAQLAACINRTASAFHQLGIKKGDRVSVMLPNCPDFVIAYYAILSLGGIVVNTNPMYVEREIQHQVNDSGSVMMVSLADFYPRIKNVREHTPLKKVILTGFAGKPESMPDDTLWLPDFYMANQEPAPVVEIDPVEDLAVLQYTGGTTGVSKGAMLTHANLYSNTVQTDYFFVGEEKKELILSVLPFFHVYGMSCCMNLSMAGGKTMILVPRFVPEEICRIISELKPTFFPGVPTMFVALRNHPAFKDPHNVMVYNSGAAPLPVELWHSYNELFEGTDTIMGEGYGLSEASPVTHSNPIFTDIRKPGSIGVPYPATDAAIVDIETGGRVMPVGEVGELIVRGPQVMKGYWNMPEQTAKTLRNGWLYTGDMAKMDEDGYFYIVDRKKDLILAGGFNIYPREVEEVLFEHPKVMEAVVAGVPDQYRGETVKAYIVLKEGEAADEKEIIDFCRERMAAYKVPRKVEFRRELPKSAVGKLLRRVLVEEEKNKLGQE